MKTTVIRRSGHMKDGEHHSIEVVVELRDADDIVLGRAPTEKEALAAAKSELERFRREQEKLSTPAVIAARQALAKALQEAEEA